MNEIQNEEYSSRNDLYEVLSGNKKIIYGFTSNIEKDRIEEEYPDKFIFKKLDYINLEKLKQRSKIGLIYSSEEKIMLIILILSFISFIATAIVVWGAAGKLL